MRSFCGAAAVGRRQLWPKQMSPELRQTQGSYLLIPIGQRCLMYEFIEGPAFLLYGLWHTLHLLIGFALFPVPPAWLFPAQQWSRLGDRPGLLAVTPWLLTLFPHWLSLGFFHLYLTLFSTLGSSYQLQFHQVHLLKYESELWPGEGGTCRAGCASLCSPAPQWIQFQAQFKHIYFPTYRT